jgi:hypothetical protein
MSLQKIKFFVLFLIASSIIIIGQNCMQAPFEVNHSASVNPSTEAPMLEAKTTDTASMLVPVPAPNPFLKIKISENDFFQVSNSSSYPKALKLL